MRKSNLGMYIKEMQHSLLEISVNSEIFRCMETVHQFLVYNVFILFGIIFQYLLIFITGHATEII